MTAKGLLIDTTVPQAMIDEVVSVTAADQVGLLWAICRWFADHDVRIKELRRLVPG